MPSPPRALTYLRSNQAPASKWPPGTPTPRSHAASTFPRELWAATWQAPFTHASGRRSRLGEANRMRCPQGNLDAVETSRTPNPRTTARCSTPAICAVNEPAINDAVARGRRAPGLPKAGRTPSYAWPSPRPSCVRESSISADIACHTTAELSPSVTRMREEQGTRSAQVGRRSPGH